MAFSAALAERIRQRLARRKNVEEKRLFGGVGFLATGEDTNGNYALWEAFVPPGGGPPSHEAGNRRSKRSQKSHQIIQLLPLQGGS